MTKRAGKRKHRMGSQRHPPGPTQREPTVEQDHLPPRESQAIELRALREGWLLRMPDGNQQALREQLMVKILKLAATTGDDRIAVAAFRALVQAETREKMLLLKQQELKSKALPEQMEPASIQPQPVYVIVQELLRNRDVINAISVRSGEPDRVSSGNNAGEIPESAPSFAD